jgi:hypothetical protein
VEYRNGTNTFKLFVALDRAGVAYFVAVPRVDQISNTTIPTTDEIFAGSASVNAGEIAAAAGSLAFTDPNTERTMIVRDLPDESTFDVYFATHTGKPDVSGTGVASPASEMILLTKVLEIGDVTPPLFVMGTPHAEGHGPKSLSVSVAASEHHSAYHVVILPSGASPPRTAVEVYTGVLAENAANSEIVFKDSGSVPFFNITSLTFFGDMSPGVAYTIYMTLADKHGNVNPVVQTVQMFTKYCMSCPALMVLAGGSACECVVPAIFTLRVRTTGRELVKNRDALKASVAEQLNVAASQVAMLSWERSLNYPGYMMVTMSVTPLSASDVATTTTVDSALASGNLTIGGAPSGVSDLMLSGEPDTRILLGSKNRPKGRTNPMTDDGSIPGQLMEEPERTNKAMFQWKVWFGDTECTECISQCKLDIGIWAMCTSPKVYFALPQGEHIFFVRGLGGDGVPDSTPARYTWTIRYRPEIFFNTAEVPPASVNRSDLTFSLSSNKPEAQFEYSFNSLDIFPTYETLPLGVTTVKVNGSVGENIFAARAVAEGEISATVARHTWVYDIFAPYANVTTSAVKNGSMVNKLTDIRFVVFGNDTDPTVLPSAGIEEIWVRFMRANDSATFPPPLFDWRLADNFKEVQAEFSLDSNISDLSDGLYVLSARAVDKAGNSQYTTDPHGYDHYYFELSKKIPGTPIISPATTFEDIMTPVNNTDTGKRQLHITSTIPSVDAYAYLFTDIINGQLFWPDGVTEIFDGDYVLADNVSYGLRFLPSKDLNHETVLLDGANPEFSFTVRSAGSFDDRALVDTPVTVHITVLSANDPPILDPDEDYHFTGLYIFDAVSTVTNWGDSVFEIVNKGFSDIDEPYKATRANMGMVILSADDTQGDWQWSDSSGRNWHHFPKDLSPVRPLLVRAGLEDRVRYFPRVENGMPLDDVAWTASITFRAWDGASGHITGSRGRWFVAEGYPVNAPLHSTAGYNGSYIPPSPQLLVPFNYPPQTTMSSPTLPPPPMPNATYYPAKFIYYNATTFDAGGSHSMTIASAYIEIYGIRHGAYVRANHRDTEFERLRQENTQQPFCPPDHGSALRLPVHDRHATVLMRATNGSKTIAVKPPWTVEAWVRRDVVTNEQTLFSDPITGSAIKIGLAPGTGITGVMLPHQSKERELARYNFYTAENNTAANDAAARISTVEASCPRWNFSLPLNRWTHLAFVSVPDGKPYRYPHASIRLYVDGLYVGSIGPDTGMNMPLGTIGFPGRAAFAVDEVKYWSYARSPSHLFFKRGYFQVGNEPGLVSYLTLDEGCGNTTQDRAAAASVDDRSMWDINVTNSSWVRQISGLLWCAEIFAITPNHVPSNGGMTVTLHGSKFRRSRLGTTMYLNNQSRLPIQQLDGKKTVCRFGYHGKGGGTFDMPATVVSAEVVTCPAATWPDADMIRGFVSVEFCDMGMSCCSRPARFDAPRLDIYPAKYMPPLQNNPELDTQVLYRYVKAISVWPLNFETFSGTTLTIRGVGFAPLVDGAKLGYPWHNDDAYCNYTAVPLDSTSVMFSASGPGVTNSVQRANKHTKMFNFSDRKRRDSVANDKGRNPMRWVSVPAHIISSAMAICETPTLPSSLTATGTVVHLRVSLVLNNGTRKVDMDPQFNYPVRAVYPDQLRVTRVAMDLISNDTFVVGQDGGTVLTLSTAHADPAADPSCQFGSVRVIGRVMGPYLVECVVPLAQGQAGDSKTVDIRFALFSFGGRYDLVYPRRGEQAIKLSWFMPANLIASTPFVVTQGAAASHAATQGEVHVFGTSFSSDVDKVACTFGFIDWSARVPVQEVASFATSLALSVLRCTSPSVLASAGFFALALNAAPVVNNPFRYTHTRPIIMFRLDLAVNTLGADAGPTDGGWLISLFGQGFLPGDGCALVVSGNRTRNRSTPGYFVSSAMLRCESPDLTRMVQYPATTVSETGTTDLMGDDDIEEADLILNKRNVFQKSILGIYLAVPGGWDGEKMVRDASAGTSATTFRPFADLDIIRPAFVPVSGGMVLHLTGNNLLSHIPHPNRGRCRVGTFDVATRPGNTSLDRITVQCVTPALFPSQKTKKSGLHVTAAPAYPSGLVGSNATVHPIMFAPTLVGVASMLVGSPAPLEGTIGPGLEIFTSFVSRSSATITVSAGSLKYLSTAMMRFACFVLDRNYFATVNDPENKEKMNSNTLQQNLNLLLSSTMQQVHVVGSPNRNSDASLGWCSLPRAPNNNIAGFSSLFVGPITNGFYSATTAHLPFEFEYAVSPEPHSFSTHRGTVPVGFLDANVRFQTATGSGGFYVASGAGTQGKHAALDITRDGITGGISFKGSRSLFHHLDKWIDTALGDGYEQEANSEIPDRLNDEKKMEPGCAWWHGDWSAASTLPIHILGQDFRQGAGMLVRFGGSPNSTPSSRQLSSSMLFAASALNHIYNDAVNIPRHTVIVPAYFVSSALVKVEPPQSMQLKPGGVPLAVTGNGGASFSTRILLYSHKFPLEQ